ncbi:translation elongation factor Ts [Kribbella jejuensis]|uniref:Elongation factor Ts n=1 Tax=Kribbella jejuensis TaxID=236068 RepID=A0A542EMJ9_9ACTN|nr:translation elongation factor Ts [Kribbella jejuensis]TQJ16474.1 translation elongation factor Ts (EF-Ts) [Kribbella jejuensis]
MANYTAADVKKLRDTTGAGMMDAKKALEATDGDFEKAIEELRIKGAAKAQKRGAERSATNGLVAAAENALVQLNCETDFVAKNEQFQQLAADIVAHAAASKVGDVEGLLNEKLSDGKSVAENIEALAAVIGEKLELGKVAVFDGQVTAYMHKRAADLPAQVGVLVEFEGDNVEAARGAAMQAAAMRPLYTTRDEVPAETVENEKRIAEATAREEGKPEGALPKIVEGRVNGFFKEVVLLEQPSVTENKKTVKAVLDEAGVTVKRFARFEVGA